MPRTARIYSQESTANTGLNVTNWKVGIYSRLSVDQNEKKSESIENQIEIIKQFIGKIMRKIIAVQICLFMTLISIRERRELILIEMVLVD